MSDQAIPRDAGFVSFAPTLEEAKIAASRAGLRAALAGRLSRNHVAPLVAFALFLAFVAILAFTGLIGRRFGEGALILAAIAFMATRTAAHWRMSRARKNSLAAMTALQQAGAIEVRLESTGLHIETAAGARRLPFSDCVEAEDAGGIFYLWPRAGAPAFVPARAFADEQAAQEFLAALRAGVRSGAAHRA